MKTGAEKCIKCGGSGGFDVVDEAGNDIFEKCLTCNAAGYVPIKLYTQQEIDEAKRQYSQSIVDKLDDRIKGLRKYLEKMYNDPEVRAIVKELERVKNTLTEINP